MDSLLDAFLADRRARGCSVNTVAKYESNVRTLIRACGWSRLRHVSVKDFLEWRAASALAPKSMNDVMTNMRGFLAWLQRQHMVSENLFDGIDRADTRLTKRFRRALSEDEQRALVAMAPHFRAVIYLLILETGLRRNEVNGLTVGDFVLDTPSPFLRLSAAQTKNRKSTVIRLRSAVVAAVRSVLPEHALPSEWVFHNRVPRIATMARDLTRAGIVFENENGRVDLHALRVTFCTNLLKAGVHPRVAQELMRHSDIKLTMKNYTDETQLPVAAALELLPDVTLRNPSETCTQKDTHGLRQTVRNESGPVPLSPELRSLQASA